MATTNHPDRRGPVMLRLRGLIAMLTLALGFGLLAPVAAYADYPVSATTTANIRNKPTTKAKIIGELTRGKSVTAISHSAHWTKIRYKGGTGYVASRYLSGAEAAPPPTNTIKAGSVMITTTTVNLRKGAATSYEVITVLADKTRVTMTGSVTKGYAQAVSTSGNGWIATKYLTSANTVLPMIIGTKIATASLDIRTTSGADAKTVAEVKKGTRLAVTGVIANGRAQIVYRSAARWVTAKYLANPTSNLPAPPNVPKITGYRYATAELNVRSTYKDDYELITEVPAGTRLAITGVVKNKRMQIVWDNTARWVTAKYLSKSKPKTPAPNRAEKGLKPNAIKVRRAILAKWPQITSIGGVRRDALPDHPSGRALDVMIPNYKSKSGKQLGFDVSRWARANADSLGVNYVIWDQHIWNDLRSGDGWRFMAGRGSDSANHKNHVHITVYAKGYAPI